MKEILLPLFAFISLCTAAQKPSSSPLTGQVSAGSISIGKCKISSITVKYTLSTFMGEPTVGSNIKWTKGYSTEEDCLAGEYVEMFLKCRAGYYSGEFLIEAGEGTTPKGDGSYGYNPLSGSPDWDELMIPYDYNSVKAFQSGRKYLGADQAKKIWKAGFTITGVVFIDRNGITVTIY
ncbi:MAG: hypothetical protein DI535_20970 [Citrobacter freundii]|nr:MAG: hypothetical protein DI535_20970 [Citrobacter freundii]